MILFLVLCLGTVSANVGTAKESLRLSIGQSGLDFASDVSAHMLTELEKLAAGGLNLPDIRGDVDITGLRLSGLHLEKPILSVVPNTGLNVKTPGVQLQVKGNWRYNGWISVTGSLTLTAKLDLSVTAGAYADMVNKRFATVPKGCSVSYRSFSIDLHNSFYSWIVSFFEDTVKSEIKKSVCNEISGVLRTTLNGVIASIPHEITIPNVMSVKFGPDSNPAFSKNQMDLPAQVSAGGQSFPFKPTGISGAMLPGYMGCILLSDYTLNTASFAALKAGKIVEKLPNKWVAASNPLMNTAYYQTILPGLYSAHPDTPITYKVVNTRYPTIQFLHQNILLHLPVNVVLEVAGSKAITASVTLGVSGVVKVSGGDITASVTSITHVSKLLDTKVGPVADLESLMDKILKNTVEPMVNNVLNQGFTLPIKEWVLLKKTSVTAQQDYLEVCGDVELTDKTLAEIKKIIAKLVA